MVEGAHLRAFPCADEKGLRLCKAPRGKTPRGFINEVISPNESAGRQAQVGEPWAGPGEERCAFKAFSCPSFPAWPEDSLDTPDARNTFGIGGITQEMNARNELLLPGRRFYSWGGFEGRKSTYFHQENTIGAIFSMWKTRISSCLLREGNQRCPLSHLGGRIPAKPFPTNDPSLLLPSQSSRQSSPKPSGYQPGGTTQGNGQEQEGQGGTAPACSRGSQGFAGGLGMGLGSRYL